MDPQTRADAPLRLLRPRGCQLYRQRADRRAHAQCERHSQFRRARRLVGKEVTGPQMAGVFTGAGSWRLEFSEASVALTCQDMTFLIPTPYTISFANNRATLDIASTPKDVVLSVDGDTLNGPAAMAVDGRIALGVSRGVNMQGQQVDVYNYQRVTRNCAKPALAKSNSPGVVGAEKNLLTSMFNDGDSGPPTPAGLRMNGSYAANTGFSVEFFPESARSSLVAARM